MAYVRSVVSLVCVCLALSAAACASTGGGEKSASPTSQGPLLPGSPTELPEFDPGMFNTLLDQLAADNMPVVLNIWASWCGPCTIEAPRLAKEASAVLGKVQFVGLDILDNRTPARAFIQRYGWPYPSIFDPTGAVRNSLGLTGQPVTVMFDRSGKRAFIWSGAIPIDVLVKDVDALIAA